MQNIADFLLTLSLFKGFSIDKIKSLIEKCELKAYNPGEVIIKFGQPGSFMGIMYTGEAEACVSGQMGESRRLGLVKPGDVLGEMSLLTGEPTCANVIALTRCEILIIPNDVVSGFLLTNPETVKIMARTLGERLRIRQQDRDEQSRVLDAWHSIPDPYGLRLTTASPEKILVLNCGSSSLKFSYFDTAVEANNMEGIVEKIGQANALIIAESKKGKIIKELGSADHSKALGAIIMLLTDKHDGVLKDFNELTMVGHRVVHGGERHSKPVVINDEVIKEIEKNCALAPLHNPLNLMAIRESMKLMPKIPQVAVFDTGFHQRMPVHAYMYGLPYEFYEKDRFRRYGFHGISHNYVALRAVEYLKRDFKELKIITCHLGSGASIAAIDHGRSIDTSMGLTPLEGLIMGTRCGDIDPSIIMYLMRDKKISVDEIDDILNRKSGLKGLSGISNDFREIEEMAGTGNSRAVVTVHVFCYRVRKYIGAYVAALGGLDVLVFTGGIGENSAWVRGLSCQGLSYMGIQVSELLNSTVPDVSEKITDISEEHSPVKVLVVPTDEGRMIARESIYALGLHHINESISEQKQKTIPIEVSAHHVHLSREDVNALFGASYELTHRADLSQPGQYACNETVNLIGPKGRVEKVRVLGPVRKQSQIEIAVTEEFRLGVKAPIRASGDLAGSPGLTLEGKDGSSHLSEGVICAARHIHMSPEEALLFGLRDRDVVMIRVEGERKLVFGDVLVRIHPDFRLAMHIDTDEANAAKITTGMQGHLVGIQERR